MKRSLTHHTSRIFALALAVMLVFGICHPAASASAESFLATHKDEIADAIVNARSSLESLGEDLTAIQEAVQAREAARQASQPEGEQPASDQVSEPVSPAAPSNPASESGAPAAEPAASESASSLRDDLLSRLGLGDSSGNEGSGGLVGVDIGDVNADLHDNPIEHDITVESDVMHDNTFEHDWSVTVDNSRFNNNTIIRTREVTTDRTPVQTGYTPASTNPKTGDLNNLTVWIIIVAVSALALAAALFFLLRKKKRK